MARLTTLQRDILQEKQDNPAASPSDIADSVGCSQSHARQTLDKYDTAHLDSAEIIASKKSDHGATDESDDDEDAPGNGWILVLALLMLIVWLINNGVL